MNNLFYLVPAASILALFFAWFFYHQMKKESEGTPTMKEIAQYVREGAMAYLKQQYKVVLIVFIVRLLSDRHSCFYGEAVLNLSKFVSREGGRLRRTFCGSCW